MVGPPSSMDSRRWRTFLRATLRSWKDYPQLRAMDRATFDRYEADAKLVQDAVAALASTPMLDAAFLSAIAPPLERLLQRMYTLGDDITAFLLFKQVGSLLEDQGLDEPAAHALQWAGRCSRDLRFYDEAQIHFDRAMVCLQRVGKDHPYFVDLYGAMGILCHLTRRWDEAESHYRRSLDLLKLWPHEVVVRSSRFPKSRLGGARLNNLLDLLLVRARHSPAEARTRELLAARKLLTRIREISGNDPIALEFATENEGEMLLLEGRVPEAKALLLRHAKHLLMGSPAAARLLPAVHRMLAGAYAEEGDVREAYAHCREALQQSLHHANAYEEGMVVEATLDIMSDAIRPRLAGAGLSALDADDRETLQNLVLMLEQKDWYTGNNHSRAVSRLSRTIGEQLVATPQSRAGRMEDSASFLDLQLLELGGLLHDIGKLRIPWSLLNKCNPLCPVEHRILESHVAEGGSMLRYLGFAPLSRLVEEHHEKLDGSGYPAGRQNLSLMGAIVAVTDAYEAMVTPNRRYATARTHESALDELEARSGVHYHPRVVLALRQVIASGPS